MYLLFQDIANISSSKALDTLAEYERIVFLGLLDKVYEKCSAVFSPQKKKRRSRDDG